MTIHATPYETNRATVTAKTVTMLANERPVCRPEWRVGVCPDCGSPLVENHYWTREAGHRHHRECWDSLGTSPTCDHRVRLDDARLLTA